MEKNLIFGALAFLENYQTSPSMSGTSNSKYIQKTYIKNAIVSLVSAKRHNPTTDVALVTNFELENQWKKELEQNGVLIWSCPFEQFVMDKEVVYSLSYYKICATDYVMKNHDYDKICFIDCDTICVSSFSPIWDEAESAFLIIPDDESLTGKIRNEIIEIYHRITNSNEKIVHYCSCIYAGKKEHFEELLHICHDMYNLLRRNDNIKPNGGDEVIWSLALASFSKNIHSPKVYVLLSNIGAMQYWVDKKDFESKDIVMWHLPAEKRYALIYIYEQFCKSNQFPDITHMAKMCRIRHVKVQYTWKSLWALSMDGNVLRRNIKKMIKR